ncbi:hypothetical protein OBBRIDRAFT_798828 [Obba rivulosa]|uniref:Translation machinery-associated protein 16 n=1 Tax=Obba rivulosa TaxID=1052685 RepID=A0A8E2AM33_9APHY|nr:hypothetical protein OBBRIDRAFT_798828 [Obba rivulosa]
MAPPKSTAKSAKKFDKKEKIFHPNSRKAGQLVRTQLRKSKLIELAKERSKKFGSQIDFYSFFFTVLPPDSGALSLQDLHTVVRDIWLTRFDAELEEEKASRRKGRPKSTREQKLEELKLKEAEDYRTGFEVIDLTDPVNVDLFRRWDQKEAAFVQQLRFVRISSTTPDLIVVSKPGKHPLLLRQQAKENAMNAPEQDMDLDEAPLLMEPPSRFASTIMAMDGSI